MHFQSSGRINKQKICLQMLLIENRIVQNVNHIHITTVFIVTKNIAKETFRIGFWNWKYNLKHLLLVTHFSGNSVISQNV